MKARAVVLKSFWIISGLHKGQAMVDTHEFGSDTDLQI